jgi:hypothetical protein
VEKRTVRRKLRSGTVIRNLILVGLVFGLAGCDLSGGYKMSDLDWCAMIDQRNHDARCDGLDWKNHTPTKNGNRLRTPFQGVFDQGYYDEIY